MAMATAILVAPNLLAATALGLGFSGFFSGASFALSCIAIPGLLLPAAKPQWRTKHPSSGAAVKPATPPSQLARQWRLVYLAGYKYLPGFALASSMCFTYVVWNLSTSGITLERNLNSLKSVFIVAATLAVSAVPWTLVFIKGTNETLSERARRADSIEEIDEGNRSEPRAEVVRED